MQGVTLLRVRPAEKTVTSVLRQNISPQMIEQLIGTSDLRALELGAMSFHRAPETSTDRYPVCAVHRRWDWQYGLTLPRWRFNGLPIIYGEAILFGLNRQKKAAECPISAMQAHGIIEWLPPATDGQPEG